MSATLARYAPGFGADEEDLELQRRGVSASAINARRQAENNVLAFYGQSLAGYMRGDFGRSRSLNRPVSGLFRERLAPTGIALAAGWTGAWLLALVVILASLLRGDGATPGLLAAGSSLLQCLPAAVLALLMTAWGRRGPAAAGATLALVLAPRVIFLSGNILAQAYRSSHVLMARARGVSRLRAILWHAVPASLPQLASFAGISVSLALSAAIPVEVVLDVPGIGQLAWQAALARDMSLLLAITMLLSVVVALSNAAAESLAQLGANREPA